MKSLQNYLPFEQVQKRNINSERAFIIDQFVTFINNERLGTKWKPASAKGIAIKLAHLDMSDLRWFLDKCNEAKKDGFGFGKYFYSQLKKK